MNRYAILMEEFNRVNLEGQQLEEEYRGKQKGNIYTQRKLDLINKKDGIKKKALSIGTTGTVCRISGKRSRPSIKNRTVLIQERFNLFFVNVTEEEVSSLVKLHVPNMIQYKVEFYKPGIILTTD